MTNHGTRRKKMLVGAGSVFMVVAVGIGLKVMRGRERGIAYQVVKVMRGEVRTTILSTGTVAPENRLDLKAPVAGRIERVLVQEGQEVRRGQVLAWMSSTERATLVDTARAKGPDEVKYWEDAYKMTPILAPGRGLIILKNADAGQTVTQTDIILSMSDRLIVKANVDETDLAQVKEGQKVRLVLDAFPDQPMVARVIHVGYDAKTVNNVTTYEVDVMANEVPDFMKSGMTANVTFLIAEKEDALLVPAAAVRHGKHKTFVLIPNPDGGDPVSREVELGLTDGKKVEIVSGLTEGAPVLTAGIRSLAGHSGKGETSPFSPFGGRRPH